MIRRFKSQVKSSLAGLSYSTGLLQRYVASRLAGRAAALMYHRVLPRPDMVRTFSTDGIVVSTDTFRMQMSVIKQLLRPLSAAQFSDCLRNGHFPDRACIVTFDDGWFDNREHALPILRELQVPALVFLATDYVGTDDCFWQERLSHMLHFALQADDQTRSAVGAALGFDLEGARGATDRRAAARQLVDRVKSKDARAIQDVVTAVSAVLRATGGYRSNASVDRFMSWEDAEALHRDGTFTIGSHCCSHTPLTKLPESQVRSELVASGQQIAAVTGSTPATMAYPNGDCSASIASIVRESGYGLAFTTARGYVAPGDDPQLLRRINIHEHSTHTPGLFLARLALLH